MNYNFTGSVTQRNINLGSVHEISSAQLAQQARDQRAVRQEIRARHAAATQIQSLVRGRRSAQQTRIHDRKAAQHFLSQQDSSNGSAAGPSRLPNFVRLTQWTAAATRRPIILSRLERQVKRSSAADALTPAEQAAFEADDELLLSWACAAVSALEQNGEDSVLIASINEPAVDGKHLVASIRALVVTLLAHLLYRPARAQQRYAPFLHVMSTLLVDSRKASGTEIMSPSQTWAQWLVDRRLYSALRAHIVALSAEDAKTSSPTILKDAVSLALIPVRLYAACAVGKATETSPRLRILRQFVEDFLTIPNLPLRIPRAALVQLAIDMPLVDIAQYIAAYRERATTHSPSETALLANFVALGWKRVPHLPDGVSVKSYMLALTKLQDGIPSGCLHAVTQNKSIPEGAMVEYEDDAVERSAARSRYKTSQAGVDATTLQRLQILCSHDHNTALLSMSAKYPNSTREALCAFLASSLQSWDVQTQDKILACVAYRYGSETSATSIANTRSSPHSIGGLVRELWRGWIRGSRLARGLSNEALQGRRDLLALLNDEGLALAWPCLIMLCHLYSRSLLTIGDDEFYPDDSRIGGSQRLGQPATASMRNPLSIDEIVTLSGLLRNLAFAMYWYEGTGGPLNDLPHNSVVGMKKMDLLSLRNIVTRLLQQLHQRDSRRPFAPKEHWLMNSELDMNSFIQSVVMEEDELNRKQDEDEENGEAGATVNDAMEVDEANNAAGQPDVDSSAAANDDDDDASANRPMISVRLANHRPAGARARALTARNLAYLSPRLGILNNIPFVIPFEVRVEIFHQFTELDYARLRRQKALNGPLREVSIRRGSVAQDGFTKLNGLGEHLKHRLAIKFIDQFGIEESGIDGGGLFKEFLTSLIKEAFDTDRGLWSATSDQQLYPNPHSYARQDDNLQWYRFLGRILGKALYHGILVDINFASFFLSKWLGRGHGYLDDLSGLESLDKEVYRNLLWLKHYAGDVEKELALDFTVLDEEFGEKRVHELVPNGKNIPVTRENRLEYIYRVSHYRLNEQIRQQSDAFLAGLTDLIDLRWLRMLNREELRILISGTEGDIDLDDLRANTVLGGYHEKDQVVDYFWAALASFTHEQRKAFLKFTTSCPSPPLLGFAQLNPKFGIRHGGDDVTRLPSASTCVNLLKLPRYTSYEQCREKLLYAIESGAGFDLS